MQEGQFDFLYTEKIGNVSSIFYLGKRLGTLEVGIKMEKMNVMLCCKWGKSYYNKKWKHQNI